MCAFFTDSAQAYRVMAPYIAEGIANRERVLSVVPTGEQERHASRLAAARVPTGPAQRSGQLVIKGWDETYLSGGRFSADGMRERVIETVRSTRDQSYERLRCWGDMGWTSQETSLDEVLRYERECDELSMKFPEDVFVCAYDPSNLRGGIVAQLAAIHPVVILNCLVYENQQ